MGLLKKKGREKRAKKGISDYKLPELPDLPEFPSVDSSPKESVMKEKEFLPQLPSFPNSSIGEKFSQESIKDAVSGKKEGVEEEDNVEDFTLPGLPDGPPTMHEPLKPVMTKSFDSVVEKPRMKEFQKDVGALSSRETMTEMLEPERKPFHHSSRDSSSNPRVRSGASARNEPVFIRIDKFEESLNVFEKTREQVREIEDLVRHAQDLKVKEGEELSKWEEEIQSIKEQIDKVDRDIFFKV